MADDVIVKPIEQNPNPYLENKNEQIPEEKIEQERELAAALPELTEDALSTMINAQDIDRERATAMSIDRLSKPGRDAETGSLKLLTNLSPGDPELFASMYTQAEYLGMKSMKHYCDVLLELKVSQGGKGRLDVKEVAGSLALNEKINNMGRMLGMNR